MLGIELGTYTFVKYDTELTTNTAGKTKSSLHFFFVLNKGEQRKSADLTFICPSCQALSIDHSIWK